MNILVITLGKSDIQVRNKSGTGFTIDDNGKNRIVLKKTGLPEVNAKAKQGLPGIPVGKSTYGENLSMKTIPDLRIFFEFPIITPLLSLFEKKM